MRPHLRAAMTDGSTGVDRTFAANEIPDLSAAIHVTGAWLRETQHVDLVAIGHRVVHGGSEFSQPVLMNETVLERLARYVRRRARRSRSTAPSRS